MVALVQVDEISVDFSAASFAAVEVGLQIVDEPTHLVVLHVAAKVVKGDPGFVWNPLEESTRTYELTREIQERLDQIGASDVRIEIRFGDAGSEIAKFAEEQQADLIVMPSHGRTGISRVLMGSVAERVSRYAHCPVLILRDGA